MTSKDIPNFNRSSTAKVPNYHTYVKAANEYLDIEEKFHKARAEEKKWKQRAYAYSNEMARISSHKLGLLGHRVVDQLRQQRTENSKTKQAKSTSPS